MPLPAAAIASIASAALTTAGNIALSERQRQMNEANQDKMNDYNLPVNQIQRFGFIICILKNIGKMSPILFLITFLLTNTIIGVIAQLILINLIITMLQDMEQLMKK